MWPDLRGFYLLNTTKKWFCLIFLKMDVTKGKFFFGRESD
jgi:hypothetical protein